MSNRIITISREFGSGGRELGKRLSDILGFDYYDREIIAAIAEAKGLDENYVEKALESGISQRVPVTTLVVVAARFAWHRIVRGRFRGSWPRTMIGWCSHA